MQTITWKHPCHICQRPIQGGIPTLIFGKDSPEFIGVCHSSCGTRKNKYGLFFMCPPDLISYEELSFLAQIIPRLYNLPGGYKPNGELRRCVAEFIQEFPLALDDPMGFFEVFLDEYNERYPEATYQGDIEADFLRLLGEVQKAAKENPLDVGIIFRT